MGGILPQSNSTLLSEDSVQLAAEEMIRRYGSKAWGMADVKARSFEVEGFHSFAVTWERVRDAIKSAQPGNTELN